MARTAETADERRARLLGVAREVIAAEGVAACTFRRLAAAAGSSTRPFTHTFGSRDAMLREVALSTWESSPIDVHNAPMPVERPADWDAVAEIVGVGEGWLPVTDERSRDERIYLEIMLFSLTRPALRTELLGFSVAANRALAALIEEGQRRGQVRSDQTAHELMIAYWGLQAGLALTAIYEPEQLSREMLLQVWRSGVRTLLTA